MDYFAKKKLCPEKMFKGFEFWMQIISYDSISLRKEKFLYLN